MATSEEHVNVLKSLCRLCGGKLAKDTFLVMKHASSIMLAFYLDITSDTENLHPPKMCLKCYSTMKNIEKRQTTSNLKTKTWDHHTDTDCLICSKHKLKAVRKAKKKKMQPVGQERPEYGPENCQTNFLQKFLCIILIINKNEISVAFTTAI